MAGLWVADSVSHWIAAHWTGARPAVAYVVLRWLVAGLAGMAVAALFQWWGELVGKVVHKTLFAPLDHLLGSLVGAVVGAAVVTVTLLAAINSPWPHELRGAVAKACTTRSWMMGGATACRLAGDAFPGSRWLGERFWQAARRTRPVSV